ncbi:hypothetical protein Pmar_PMAR019526 [Perkinsus marinus ATCC 50983]|uniref:RRM domain-containing protein n=1 Tax=Perkinsus marinus (strain ATCC 50983 / TXsc) TaxID=423536 RepID=C5KR96_PERM5|nr:hypothetical protein Pmar_PMAR019526 [Perkinsus marinus ATCC 50983]EER12997.1 hypothetical protein Pmar_PMAR019526 [Perkinsus marinus ATCC 50983]|eukprot:XP_002781202.1 hypothetical protein Pmar_PMAR019526 [Perkinsus marinus ATCC 50983]
MSGRVDTRERQEAPDINIVATAAGSLSLPSLKSSRTTARAARTRLANRLAAQRQVIRDREAEGVGEEDPELHALLVEEEELEDHYADACAKVTLAERAYDEALVKARSPEPSIDASPTGEEDDLATPLVNTSNPSPSRLKNPNAITAKIFLPKLKDKFRFREHNEMAGIIFHEAGLGTLDDQGIFTATVPETILVTKYLQSLENVAEVYERAMDVAIQTKYRWREMSDILNQVFGDRVAMRTEVARRLRELRFKGYQYVDDFIHHVTIITNMWMAVYSAGFSESRYLVASFLAKLPSDLLEGVVNRILREVPKEGAPIWEDYVRVHNTAPAPRLSPAVDLCQMVRSVCKVAEVTHHLQPKASPDRIRQVSDNQGSLRRGPTITEWASNFPEGSVVYFRTDKAISPESIRKTFSDLGAKEVRAHVHKRGHRYGFATFDNKAEASKLIHNGVPASSEGTSQGLKIRAFVPGSTRGRPVMKSGN